MKGSFKPRSIETPTQQQSVVFPKSRKFTCRAIIVTRARCANEKQHMRASLVKTARVCASVCTSRGVWLKFQFNANTRVLLVINQPQQRRAAEFALLISRISRGSFIANTLIL